MPDVRVTHDQGYLNTQLLFEWYNPGDGKNHLHYEGIAPAGMATSEALWQVRKFDWAVGPDGTNWVTTRIQVLLGVWDNRATLSWMP
jgi:hypothetical protein